MARKFYNQANVTVLVDGVLLEDLAEGDDAVTIEPQGDGFTLSHGANGNAVGKTSRRPHILTVRLKAQSASISFLNGLAKEDRAIDSIVTTGVNSRWTCTTGLIENQGISTGGTGIPSQTFRIGFAYGEEVD